MTNQFKKKIEKFLQFSIPIDKVKYFLIEKISLTYLRQQDTATHVQLHEVVTHTREVLYTLVG